MANYNVHRLRYGDWMPSSKIKSIACDPFSPLIAVGREDGDIEICDSANKWNTILHIPGRKDFRLQTLMWSQHSQSAGRLFGLSLHCFLFEVDFKKLSIKNIRDTYGGASWCMTQSLLEPVLAVGCDDGTIRLYDILDNNGLEYSKSFPTTGSKIFSIAYHPNQQQLYAGCADGTIRCFDTKNGTQLHRMTGERYAEKSAYILCLAVLKDSTVISGDSQGNVQIWDGKIGVLSMNIHQHTAEILSIAISPDETSIFASGVDSRVTCIQKLVTAGQQDHHWVYTTAHRPHTHDVFSLAIALNHSNSYMNMFTGPVLISGGIDGKLCMYSVNEFIKIRPFWILPIPANGLVSSSQDGKLMALRHQTHLDIWSVKGGYKMNQQKNDNEMIEDEKDLQLLTQIQLQQSYHIYHHMLSADGQYLALTTAKQAKLWKLKQQSGNELEAIKLITPRVDGSMIRQIHFNPVNNNMIAVMESGNLALLEVQDEEITLKHIFPHVNNINQYTGEHHAQQALRTIVTNVVFRQDGQYFAVSDGYGSIYMYDLDLLRLHWSLPSLSSPISAINFSSSLKPSLFGVITSMNDIFVFDVDSMDLTPWSKENTTSPEALRNLPCSLRGIQFDHQNPYRIFLHGQNNIISINLKVQEFSKVTPKILTIASMMNNANAAVTSAAATPAVTAATPKKGNKRTRQETQEEVDNQSPFTIANLFSSIISVQCINDHQMVVVENPWMHLLERLPTTLYRKRYGT